MSHTDIAAPTKTMAGPPNHRTRTLVLAVTLAVALVVALGVALGVALATRGSGDKAEADQVRTVDQALRQALLAADSVAAGRLLASDVMLITPDGDQESRDSYLGSISAGELRYQLFDPVTPVDVEVAGDLAVVTYKSHLAVTSGADHLEHYAWHTHVYQKRHGDWLQIWSQATAVGGFPPPGS